MTVEKNQNERTEQKEWYTMKEIFEMLNEFKEDVSDSLSAFKDDVSGLRAEIRETKTIIREYNGLRSSVNNVNDRIGKVENTLVENKDHKRETKNLRVEFVGYIIAAITIIISVLNYLKG